MHKSKQFLMVTIGLGLGIVTAGAAQAESWQGPHIGVFAGLGQNDNLFVDENGFVGPGPGALDPENPAPFGATARYNYGEDSLVYGVVAGYDWQFGDFVAGLELDFTLADVDSAELIDVSEGDETAFTNFAHVSTLRARAGWAQGGFLIFGTAGVALGVFENELFDIDQDENGAYTVYDTDDSFVSQNEQLALVFGGGVEVALSDTWHLRAEGQYMDFGRDRQLVNLADDASGSFVGRGPQPFEVENDMLIIRMALTFGF